MNEDFEKRKEEFGIKKSEPENGYTFESEGKQYFYSKKLRTYKIFDLEKEQIWWPTQTASREKSQGERLR